MASWKTQTINHEVRINLGLSVMDYCILDYIYHTQSHPDYGGKIDGWCNIPMSKICDFFGISKGGISLIFSKMEECGFLEFSSDRSQKRATKKWYSTSYMSDEERQRSFSERSKIVHILNGMRSLSERKAVHFLNATIIYKFIKDKLNTKLDINDESLIFDFTKKQVKEMEKALKAALKIENAEKKKKEYRPQTEQVNLMKEMATDFDSAFVFVSGQTNSLIFGKVDGEGMQWGSSSGKEFGNLKKLSTILADRIKEKNGNEAKPEEIRESWRMFLRMAIDTKEKFILTNFTPSMVLNQFNQIILKIQQSRNGKKFGNSAGAASLISERDFNDVTATLMAKYSSQGSQ